MSNMSPDKPPPAGPHSVCLDFGGQTKPHVRSCDSHDFNIDIEIVGGTQNRCQKCGCQICVSQNDSFRETNADVPIVGVLFCGFQLTQSQKQLSYLTATTECVTVHSSNDGFPGGWLDFFGRVGHVSPYQGDVAPPLKEVLAIVGGKVPVLHLLDISSSCKCLKYES